MAEDFLPLLMFVTLLGLMLTGYPIGVILGGVAILFGFIGMAFDLFRMVEFFNLVPRVWYFAENLQLVAVPLLILMGVLLERSRLAQDLLLALGLMLRGIPGGTALSVTVMSVLFAAITGVVGASVIVMTLIALPPMLRAGYHPPLALGTIAAASTLGILIPPSILLVFLCEMLQISYGYLFAAAIYPGLSLAGLYMVYIAVYAFLKPDAAPKLSRQQFLEAQPPEYRDIAPSWAAMVRLVAEGIIPTAILIMLVMGSVLSGIFTVTESAAVGVLGALTLAAIRGRLSLASLHESLKRASMSIGMVAEDLISSNQNPPYRLVGHSFAGILAFETAAQLEKRGVSLVEVILLDAALPALGYWELRPRQWLASIAYFVKYAAQRQQDRWRDRRTGAPAPRFLHKRNFLRMDLSAHPPAYQFIIRELYRAMTCYCPSRFSGKLTLLRATKRGLLSRLPNDLGWQRICRQPIRIIDVECDHLSMVRMAPEAHVVASWLARLCDGASTAPASQFDPSATRHRTAL